MLRPIPKHARGGCPWLPVAMPSSVTKALGAKMLDNGSTSWVKSPTATETENVISGNSKNAALG